MTEPTINVENIENVNNNRAADPWDIPPNVPQWQAAIIRLARPAALWVLAVGVMGLGTAIVGAVEAIAPGAGVRMTTAMAGLLIAYPEPLYYLIAFMFAGQLLVTAIKAWKGIS
jgi:hypothetical protein